MSTTISEQHLITLAESLIHAWVAEGPPTPAVPAGIRFEESGSLFGSDLLRFLRFLKVIAGDDAYRFHWAVSRSRQRSVHIRVYLTPKAAHRMSRTATLRLRLHMADDGSLVGLTVLYRTAKLIGCLAPNRRTALVHRCLNALGIYRVRF